uniref:N-acetylgalactosamine kinase-like n=1 Tax=Styela clava TaxID=7725 RepID=UPI0019396033|nr:N-acetylgalactosamine kinase-like [Styela clava]
MATPPIFQLEKLMDTDEKQHKRFSQMCEAFKQKYGSRPEFIARAPGRVNLIGEHIDYCGYSVLPMAIEQDICAAVKKTNTGEIRICNLDAKNYKDFTTSIKNIVIDKSNPQWFHYFFCGFKGIVENESLQEPVGMDILVHGTVPKNAGLSSSSALVCVAGLATAFANGKSISKLNMADICAKCERYIGTQGGGMDQSISFLAEKGAAKLISFNPLRTEEVSLPDGSVFVISNCCVELNKAATSHFNQRVAECKISTKVLAKQNGVDITSVKTFKDLQTKLEASFDKILDLVKTGLHDEPYSRSEILEILGISDEQLVEYCLSENTKDVQTFRLRQRSEHVFSEAQRVLKFKEACDSKDMQNKNEALGNLMTASHVSCSKSYECSCLELDQLTQLCRDSGALGSRLTGAGWGGCAVSIVPSEKLESFLTKVKTQYFDNLGQRMTGRTMDEVLFATKPGSGAAVYVVN